MVEAEEEAVPLIQQKVGAWRRAAAELAAEAVAPCPKIEVTIAATLEEEEAPKKLKLPPPPLLLVLGKLSLC